MTPKVEAIYAGKREVMVAEVAAFDPTSIGVKPNLCEYLIMPVGNAQWDIEYAATAKDRDELAKELASVYGVEIVYL